MGSLGIGEAEGLEYVEIIQERNRIVVKYNLNKAGRVDIRLFNSLGSVLERVSGDETAGEHIYTFDISIPGVYFVKINIDNRDEIKKVVITN